MTDDIRLKPPSTTKLLWAVLGSMDIWSNIAPYLTAKDCGNTTMTSRLLRETLTYNTLVWKVQYEAKWGRNRIDGLAGNGSSRPDWRQAFEQLQCLSNAALSGKWFEYDGCFAQTTSTYRFSLSLHCTQRLQSPDSTAPVIDPAVAVEGERLLKEEANFRASYDSDHYAYLRPFLPVGPILYDAEHVPYPESYAQSVSLPGEANHYCPLLSFGLDIFTSDDTSLALNAQRCGYSMFFPVALPSELLRIKYNHLSSSISPTPDLFGCISVMGVITWTTESTVYAEHIRKDATTAQEFVQGFYQKETRMLYLVGMGRNLTALDAFLGVDIYKLQLSPDGHSFSGFTLGNMDDPPWSCRMQGGTRLFRENIINMMRDEVSLQYQARIGTAL